MADASNPSMEKSTTQVDHKSGRSVAMFLIQKILRPIRSQLLKHGEEIKEESPEVDLPSKAKKLCTINERRVNELRVYDFTAKTTVAGNGKRKRVVYFAGGGWQMPPSAQHVNMIASLTHLMANTTISLVSYPLAPHFAAPKSLPRLAELYMTMLNEAAAANETIVLAGDSAGANIALCLPLYILRENPEAPVPAAVMALSPSTDLRRQNPMMDAVAVHDPLLTIPFIKSTADKWRAEWDAFDPRVSPLAADLQVLADRGVSVHGATGTYDILSLDAVLFRTRLAETGIKGRWLEWDRQMHVWVLLQQYGLREAKEGLAWVANVLNEV